MEQACSDRVCTSVSDERGETPCILRKPEEGEKIGCKMKCER